jgi:hypothetical protein
VSYRKSSVLTVPAAAASAVGGPIYGGLSSAMTAHGLTTSSNAGAIVEAAECDQQNPLLAWQCSS